MTLGLLESYNRTRYVEELLEKTEDKAPSLTIHLHPEHWVLNNGSKFLYHNQMASLLDDIRAHRIPVDFLDLFDDARVPFYDGCMVVELLDYRAKRSRDPQPEKPDRTRVILHPNPETLYADVCALNARSKSNWTDRDALEIESKLLLATAPPLCLDPTPHLTRIANHVLRASTPTVPMSLKRKASTHEPEEDETEKTRRTKIMAFMAPRNTRQHAPNYSFYETFVRHKQEKYVQAHETAKNPPPAPNHNYLNGPPIRPPPKVPTPTPTPVQRAPVQIDNQGQIIYNVAPDNTQGTYQAPNYSTVPSSGPSTHQFVSQASPVPPAATGMAPQVYRSVQEATAAATAQRANAATPVAGNSVAMAAHHHQQMQMLQKAQMQQQTLSLANQNLSPGVPPASQPRPNQGPQTSTAQLQTQGAASPSTAQPPAPSAISPSTSGNPTYGQAPNHYPNQQNIQRPSSVAPGPISMSASGQSQAGQPSAPPMAASASAGSAQRPAMAQVAQQLRLNSMRANQAYATAQAHAQANPNDVEARKAAAVAHASAVQEKHKFDTFVNHFKMQSARAAAQAAGATGPQSSGSQGVPTTSQQHVTGRATPQNLNLVASGSQGSGQPSAAPTPSPARASPMVGVQGLPMQGQQQHPQQQQPPNPMMQQTQQPQQFHRTMTPTQGQPQQQQTLQVPGQPQQPQLPGQFTFTAPYNHNPNAMRTGTPSNVPPGQFTFAVSQGNAGRMTAGTPVPGGGQVSVANAQRSPQQMQMQQQQQQQQQQQMQQIQHQQAMQQQMRTPQMQNQQLRTPQTQTQQLRTPQMQSQQLRTPQTQTQPLRTPQMQAQQLQAAQQRQPTPQQNMPPSVQAAMQGQPQAQQQQQQAQMQMQMQQQPQQGQMSQMTPQQYQQTMQQYYRYYAANNGQQQQHPGQGQVPSGPTPAQMQAAQLQQRIAALTPQQQQVYWARARDAQAQAAMGTMAGGGAVMGGVAIGGVPQQTHQFSLSVGGGGQVMQGQGQPNQAAMIAAANAAKMKQQQQQGR
ncbi:Spt20 family-domain-containing protein [Coprinopsis sp. MPI-PUGE-AT-0042]|nr:Spt20 family-domain-containing protein [Coprinopsis sp. MPI-PUGE-AT-0042]